MYTALLRLPNAMSQADKEARVDEVVLQLGLIDCKHTRIGNAFMRGVSGGERKRASIGIEIIVNPRILFLDEPTSGLDSYTAFHIMETVRSLTKSGRSVICSIHQPREKIYHVSARCPPSTVAAALPLLPYCPLPTAATAATVTRSTSQLFSASGDILWQAHVLPPTRARASSPQWPTFNLCSFSTR